MSFKSIHLTGSDYLQYTDALWGVVPIAVDLTHGLSNDDVISDLTFSYISVSFEN